MLQQLATSLQLAHLVAHPTTPHPTPQDLEFAPQSPGGGGGDGDSGHEGGRGGEGGVTLVQLVQEVTRLNGKCVEGLQAENASLVASIQNLNGPWPCCDQKPLACNAA